MSQVKITLKTPVKPTRNLTIPESLPLCQPFLVRRKERPEDQSVVVHVLGGVVAFFDDRITHATMPYLVEEFEFVPDHDGATVTFDVPEFEHDFD